MITARRLLGGHFSHNIIRLEYENISHLGSSQDRDVSAQAAFMFRAAPFRDDGLTPAPQRPRHRAVRRRRATGASIESPPAHTWEASRGVLHLSGLSLRA